MFDVNKLNESVQEIGLDHIAWIAECSEKTDDWECYGDPVENGHLFGFDYRTITFSEDLTRCYEGYNIEENPAIEGMYNIVFYGNGTDYDEEKVG